MQVWGFLGGPVISILGFHCSGLDLISVQGTGTPQAKQHGQMNKVVHLEKMCCDLTCSRGITCSFLYP